MWWWWCIMTCDITTVNNTRVSIYDQTRPPPLAYMWLALNRRGLQQQICIPLRHLYFISCGLQTAGPTWMIYKQKHISDFKIGQLHSKIPCWDSPRTVRSWWSHVKFTMVQLQYFCSSSAPLCTTNELHEPINFIMLLWKDPTRSEVNTFGFLRSYLCFMAHCSAGNPHRQITGSYLTLTCFTE